MQDFGSFCDRVKAKNRTVARATGLAESTVSRLRSGKIKNPRRDVLLKLIDWADEEALRHGLKPEERLDWAERDRAH